ncbi:MAG: hypothetical protein AAF829_12345 [Pseudomonadota bacterium]
MKLAKQLSVLAMASAICPIASADVVGRWCYTMISTMPNYDAIIQIEENASGEHLLTMLHGDGSQNQDRVVRDGNRYRTGNEFGEYYQVNANGTLGMHDNDVLIQNARRADVGDRPGDCR